MSELRPGNQIISDAYTSLAFFDDQEEKKTDFISSLELHIDEVSEFSSIFDEIANHREVRGKTFTLRSDNEAYESISNPLQSLESLLLTWMVIIMVIGGGILILVLTNWIRERKREIGILFSLGKRKWQIMSQIFCEFVFIGVFAMAMSVFSTNMLADHVADIFVSQANNQVEEASLEDLFQGGSFYFDGTTQNALSTNEEQLPTFDVTISTVNMVWMSILGLGIILIAVSVASYSIMRMKPKDILSQMS